MAATLANGHVVPSGHKEAKDTRSVLFVDIDNTVSSRLSAFQPPNLSGDSIHDKSIDTDPAAVIL